jgi:Ca-activated chloride channel homolog
MRLPNRLALFFPGLVLLAGLGLRAQSTPAPQSNAAQVQATQLPPDVDPNDPALPVWARAAVSANPDIPSVKAPGPGATPEPGEVTRTSRGFAIGVRVDEVTLPATVVDHDKRVVTTLKPNNFVIYEDGVLQRITSFKYEDIPVSIGILVDNSGSMRAKRNAVTKAVVNLIQASNPRDEVFIVNFNDEPYLDQDFTNKIELLREALDRVDSRGGTALYDAIIAAADHLRGGNREKKVLLVVTDGVDNESRESLEQAIRAVQSDQGPQIYAIGILDEEGKKRQAKRALEAMTTQTGGLAFFPKTLAEVDAISQEVARDIRNQYRITYKPTNPLANKGYRILRVEARGEGFRGLEVRTRKGYFASEDKSASTAPAAAKRPH